MITYKDTFRFFAAVITDWLIIIAMMVLAVKLSVWWMFIIAVLVIGNRQHAIAILGHDMAHKLASSNRFVNNVLGAALTFWPFMVDRTAYFRFHWKHHREVGTPGDPELLHKNATAADWYVPTSISHLIILSIADLLVIGSVYNIYWVIKLTHFSTLKEAVMPLAFVTVAWITLLLTGNWIVLVLWYVAFFSSFWCCFRWRVWTEHKEDVVTSRVHLPWYIAWLIAPHNTWYHWEHHKEPAVPFSRLPQVRAKYAEPPIKSYWQLMRDLT